MLFSTRSFIELLNQRKIKYALTEASDEQTQDYVEIQYAGDNLSVIRMTLIFDQSCEGVSIRVFDLFTIPEDKLVKMYRILNELNRKYRFAKFCINTSDRTVQIEMDAPVRAPTTAEVCLELMIRTVTICDESYPVLMKAMWG